MQSRPVCQPCKTGTSSAVWKLALQDGFMGWISEQRGKKLSRARIPNLGSHLLAVAGWVVGCQAMCVRDGESRMRGFQGRPISNTGY